MPIPWSMQSRDSEVLSDYEPEKDGDDWGPAILAMEAVMTANKRPATLDVDVIELTPTTVSRFVATAPAGVELRGEGTSSPLIRVAGTIGDFEMLEADALRRSNVLVCSTIAAEMALMPFGGRGVLLQITSDAPFELTNTARKQGEQARVYAVQGANIYLSRTLHDTYLADDNARIAIVDPGYFHVAGEITIRNPAAAPNDRTRGIELAYCMKPRIELAPADLTHTALAIYSCWNPRWRLCGENDITDDSAEGQPVLISGSTMYSEGTGFAANARHAVAHGAAPAYHGVPWASVIHGFRGLGSKSGNAIIDAHGQCGSVYLFDVVLEAGQFDTEAGTGTVSSAISTAARYTFIRGARLKGVRLGVTIRSDTDRMERLDIDDMTLEGVVDHGLSFNQSGVTIARLSVNNVRGSCGGRAVSLSGGTVGKIERLSDIYVDEGGILTINTADQVTVPDHIVISRGASRYASPQSAGTRAIDIQNSAVKRVQVYEVDSSAGELLRTSSAVTPDLVEVINCNGRQANVRYVNVEGNAGTVNVEGGEYGDTQSGNGSILRLAAGVTVERALVAPSRVYGSNLTQDVSLGAGASLGRIMRGGALDGLTQLDTLEVVAGSFDAPTVLRGSGPPEGVVSATPGTKYLRTNGLIYTKRSGTGTTGWKLDPMADLEDIAFVDYDVAEDTTTNGTDLDVPLPALAEEGHYAVIQLRWRFSTDNAMTLPDGWEQLTQVVSSSNGRSCIVGKAITGDEPSDYHFEFPGGLGRSIGVISVWSGVDLAQPVEVALHAASIVAPSVTPTMPQCRILRFFGDVDCNGIDAPAGSQRYKFSTTSGGRQNVTLADYAQADGDVETGTATGTAGGSTTSPNAFTVALRAA